jgi:hypothetical protein
MALTAEPSAFVRVIRGIYPLGLAVERRKRVKIFVFCCLLWYIDLTRSAVPSHVFLRRVERSPFRVNPEQARKSKG